jgi:hypothetical protein
MVNVTATAFDYDHHDNYGDAFDAALNHCSHNDALSNVTTMTCGGP